jgi:membrane protease YdiL (CAAX protease family)
MAVVMPATILFPVIAMLGTDHQHWLGASILALGFAAGGVAMLRYTRRTANIAETELSLSGVSGCIGLLIVGVGLCYLLQPVSELITRIIIALIFVAFLEEFFFRGYVQARLNEVFGRPYSLFNVNYGAGLILASVIFGLFHPLTVTNETPWAWALWTTTGGLVFGFLREKSGAVVTPALVHGAILVPGVLFGGSG